MKVLRILDWAKAKRSFTQHSKRVHCIFSLSYWISGKLRSEFSDKCGKVENKNSRTSFNAVYYANVTLFVDTIPQSNNVKLFFYALPTEIDSTNFLVGIQIWQIQNKCHSRLCVFQAILLVCNFCLQRFKRKHLILVKQTQQLFIFAHCHHFLFFGFFFWVGLEFWNCTDSF